VWSAETGSIDLLFELPDEDNNITSVKWMEDGSHLAVGTAYNNVQMWNVERKKQVRSMKGHVARVGALSWNRHILSSGSRDSTIFNHDVRVADHHIATMRGHEQVGSITLGSISHFVPLLPNARSLFLPSFLSYCRRSVACRGLPMERSSRRAATTTWCACGTPTVAASQALLMMHTTARRYTS
jgi:WD40 repeat protein